MRDILSPICYQLTMFPQRRAVKAETPGEKAQPYSMSMTMRPCVLQMSIFSITKEKCVLNEQWRITRLWLSDANVSTLSLAGGLSLHLRSSPILCRVRRERSREPLE